MNQSPNPSPAVSTSLGPVAESFLACLQGARHETSPFDYWLLENPLPEGYCEAIANLPFPPPLRTLRIILDYSFLCVTMRRGCR